MHNFSEHCVDRHHFIQKSTLVARIFKGFLIKKFTLPVSGDYPKDVVIFPDNQHIAVVNHASNNINVFTIDYEKNIMMMKGYPHHVDKPNSIHIWAVPEHPATELDEVDEAEDFNGE